MPADQPAPSVPGGLARTLGVPGVTFLTLSVATPASSVFTILPGMFQVAGSGALWAFLVAALVCVATALVYAELSSAWPVAGGEYVAVAHTLGPGAGFVMLGINVFNNLLFPPVLGLGLSAVMAPLWPGLPSVPLAIAAVAGSMLVACLRIRVNAWLTGVFLLVEVLAIAAIVWTTLGHLVRPPTDLLAHPMMPAGQGLVAADARSIGLATAIGIFALNGYGVAVYFGEELHEAPATIARAVLLSLVAIVLLEGIPLVTALIATPDLRAFSSAEEPFGPLVAALGGAGLSRLVLAGVAVAIVNAIVACVLACARFFYGTARDGSWGGPLDRWMVQVHPRLGSPVAATLLVGAAGIACCFLPLTLLLLLNGTGLVAIYAGISLAALAGRRSGATAHARYRMPLYPLAPLLTLAALAYVAWTSWLDPAEGRPALLLTAAQIAVSAGYYALFLRPRGWTARLP